MGSEDRYDSGPGRGLRWYQHARAASVAVRVVKDASEPVYSVYPIPATTELNIVLNPAIQRANIQIYSLSGVKALDRDYTVAGIGKVKLLVKNLAPGAYTLRVQSAQGSYTKAFVKK